MNTIVFKNRQKTLKELYVPLRIDFKKEGGEDVRIESYPQEWIQKCRGKILIEDTAGMGKSTLLKRLFLDVVDNAKAIPIFVELRRLSGEHTILQEIYTQLNSLTKEFDKSLMLELFKKGGFIFLLDGYDEIALNEREAVIRDLQDFISKAGDNEYLLTSRPENALSSFGDFWRTSINPLEKEEAYALLTKYDNEGKISQDLIRKIQQSEYRAIEEFLSNPLLASLLFTAYEHKQIIPLKKHLFYRQVYDALLEGHDLSKGESYIHERRCKLDRDDFERILRAVAFSGIKEGKIELPKEKLLFLIGKIKNSFPGLTFSPSLFLEDLLQAVPLFCKEGTYYRWAHKSLQEYFAALFIYQDTAGAKDQILSAIYNGENIEKYYNLLDLYYDIDPYGFRKNILLPFLKEYKDYLGEKEEADNICRGLLFKRNLYVVVLDYEEKEEEDPFGKTQLLLPDEKLVCCVMYLEANEQYIICAKTLVSKGERRLLLSLLYTKKSDYIEEYTHESENDLEKFLVLDRNVPYHVSSEEYNELYKLNLKKQVLFLISDSGGKADNLYIKFEKCCQEIESIEQEIAFKENAGELLEGL